MGGRPSEDLDVIGKRHAVEGDGPLVVRCLIGRKIDVQVPRIPLALGEAQRLMGPADANRFGGGRRAPRPSEFRNSVREAIRGDGQDGS